MSENVTEAVYGEHEFYLAAGWYSIEELQALVDSARAQRASLMLALRDWDEKVRD